MYILHFQEAIFALTWAVIGSQKNQQPNHQRLSQHRSFRVTHQDFRGQEYLFQVVAGQLGTTASGSRFELRLQGLIAGDTYIKFQWLSDNELSVAHTYRSRSSAFGCQFSHQGQEMRVIDEHFYRTEVLQAWAIDGFDFSYLTIHDASGKKLRFKIEAMWCAR